MKERCVNISTNWEKQKLDKKVGAQNYADDLFSVDENRSDLRGIIKLFKLCVCVLEWSKSKCRKEVDT